MKAERIVQAMKTNEEFKNITIILDEEIKIFNYGVIKTFTDVMSEELQKLYIDARKEMLLDIQKINGTLDKKKMIDNMFKKGDNIGSLIGYSKYNDKYVFLDGHRIFISNDNLGYNPMERKLELNRFLNADLGDTVDIDLDDLKVFIKENNIKHVKNHNKQLVPYTHKHNNNTIIGFNPIYLLQAIEWAGEGYTIRGCLNNISKSPFYVYNSKGDLVSMVLPVNLPKK